MIRNKTKLVIDLIIFFGVILIAQHFGLIEHLSIMGMPLVTAAGLTFGYTSIGAGGENYKRWQAFGLVGQTPGSSGTASNIKVCCSASSTDYVKLGLYTGSGTSYTRVNNGYTSEITITRTTKPTQDSEWTSGDITASVDGSTAYTIFYYASNSGVATFYRDNLTSGTVTSAYNGTPTYANFPSATITTTGTENYKYSIYATYQASAPTPLSIESDLVTFN